MKRQTRTATDIAGEKVSPRHLCEFNGPRAIYLYGTMAYEALWTRSGWRLTGNYEYR